MRFLCSSTILPESSDGSVVSVGGSVYPDACVGCCVGVSAVAEADASTSGEKIGGVRTAETENILNAKRAITASAIVIFSNKFFIIVLKHCLNRKRRRKDYACNDEG